MPCKGTAEEVSFEWSHHRISSTDSKVRTTLHDVSMTDSGMEGLTDVFTTLKIELIRFYCEKIVFLNFLETLLAFPEKKSTQKRFTQKFARISKFLIILFNKQCLVTNSRLLLNIRIL